MKFPYKVVKVAEAQKCCDRVKTLENEILLATNFIKNIEKGNLDIELATNSSDDLDKNSLTGSLISMRDQMKLIANDEKERKWTTEGLAKFVDILRSNNDNLSMLADDILTNLVKYMNANQGYLFILNDNDVERKLDLAACYAYNRKKYISKSIMIGEGLVGQCFLEKEYIYMNNLPQDYVNITSGLGESLPRHLILVPLMINEEVYGVVEMASFNSIEKYQIEFLVKLGESIASTIANVKVAERTKKLLDEAQMMAEQLRSQEEEMRQNMEELSATQEEMQRTQAEAVEASVFMNQLINASTDIIYTIDKDYKVIHFNDALKNSATGKHFKIDRGFDSLLILGDNKSKIEEFKLIISKVFNGETINIKEHYKNAVADVYLDSTYAPVKSAAGDILGVAVFVKNITELTLARMEAEKLLAEAQQQSEELKAQEEELRQNMEELSATQDELQRNVVEIETIRKTEKERADSQIASQKKIMEQFIAKTKEKENQLLQRIKELEAALPLSV